VTATILEIPEVRQRVSPLSVEEYHRLGEFNENGRRTELIRGIVIEKMSKSPAHSTIVALLYRLLLARVPTGLVVRQEQPLTFKDSEPEPDIAIVQGTERDFSKSHPGTAELVIEVALANPALDLENAALYAEANVKEYWILFGKERHVEVYRRPENGRYLERLRIGPSDTLQCLALPGVTLLISDLLP
jgi:Uma2 family endonuclease